MVMYSLCVPNIFLCFQVQGVNTVCHYQYCQIWLFLAIWATFEVVWQQKITLVTLQFGYFSNNGHKPFIDAFCKLL